MNFFFFLVAPGGLWDLGSRPGIKLVSLQRDAQSLISLDPQGSPRSEGLTPKLLAPLLFISVQCWSLYCLQSCPQPSLQIPGPRVTAAARSPAREEGSLHIYRHESSSKQLSLVLRFPCSIPHFPLNVAPGSECSLACVPLRMNSKEQRGQMDIC